MTERAHNQNWHEGLGPLIRAAADDELSAADAERLERIRDEHPEVDEHIAFERALRAACGRAMGDVQAPAALRARVETLMAEARASARAEDGPEAAGPAPELGSRDRSFWAGGPNAVVRWLALGVAAVLIGALSLTIWQVAQARPAYRTQVISFVADEHHRCLTDESSSGKFVYASMADLEASLEPMLGADLRLPEVTPAGGVEFVDGGRCGVPGASGSGHIRFQVRATEEHPRLDVSLFVLPDTGSLGIEAGTTYSVDTAACGVGFAEAVLWSDGALVYLMVAESAGEGCAKLLEAMRLPEPTDTI